MGSKLFESVKNHPRPWLVVGSIGAVVAWGTYSSAANGELDRFKPGVSTPAPDNSRDETQQSSKNNRAPHEKEPGTKKSVGGIACTTTVTYATGRPTISVTFDKGIMPDNGNALYTLTYRSDQNDTHYRGSDRGNPAITLSAEHGGVLHAQAVIDVHGEQTACAPWNAPNAHTAKAQ